MQAMTGGDDGAGVTSGHAVIPGERPRRIPNPSDFLLSLAHPSCDQAVQRCRLAPPSGSTQTRCTSTCSIEATLALQVAVTRRLPVAIHLGCRADHRGDLGLSAISVSILFAAGLLAVCLLCASVCLAAELCGPRAGTAVAQHQNQLATYIEARLKLTRIELPLLELPVRMHSYAFSRDASRRLHGLCSPCWAYITASQGSSSTHVPGRPAACAAAGLSAPEGAEASRQQRRRTKSVDRADARPPGRMYSKCLRVATKSHEPVSNAFISNGMLGERIGECIVFQVACRRSGSRVLMHPQPCTGCPTTACTCMTQR